MQHYNAAKGGLVALSRGIAVEAGRYGIRFKCRLSWSHRERNGAAPGRPSRDELESAPTTRWVEWAGLMSSRGSGCTS